MWEHENFVYSISISDSPSLLQYGIIVLSLGHALGHRSTGNRDWENGYDLLNPS